MAGTIFNIASDGVRCALSPLGAAIASVQVRDRGGRFIDVALAPRCLFDGTPDPFTAGRTIGSCCGRIREGRITIDGVPIQLARNDGMTLEEFKDWFFGQGLDRTVFSGVIIHFTDFRYNTGNSTTPL